MKLSKLFIDKEIADLEYTDFIVRQSGYKGEVIDDVSTVYDYIQNSEDPILKAKETLYLTQNQGAYLKKCPGTDYYNCCDYQILHVGTFCDMDCSYCILQAYFHPPVMQYFVNHDDMNKELDRAFQEDKINRIGTGEYTDSLIWEKWTGLSGLLVKKFAGQQNSILELKTKTTSIDYLKSIDHNFKTITSWSLNTEKVIAVNEKKTASLDARLKAAAKCESWGYRLGFHFDPMVIYDGCEPDYKDVIRKIFRHVKGENIAWISIGSFRYIPSLKQVIEKRFDQSKIIYGEFIRGEDGKMRYFKPLRISLYRSIIEEIKKHDPSVTVYFCMEDEEVWNSCLGYYPKEPDLGTILDKSAQKVCRLNPGL